MSRAPIPGGVALPTRRTRSTSGPMAVVPAGRRALPLVIAPMLFLATLATALVLAAGGLVDRWQSGLQGTATVEVPPVLAVPGVTLRGREQARIDTERVAAVLAVLDASPAVAAARPLGADELARLIDPWIDSLLLVDDLPVPVLIDVELTGDGRDVEALARAVADAAPGARLDTHQQWLGELVFVAGSIRLVGAVVVAVAVGAAIATIVTITRAELMIHRRTIAILHVMGATDLYIARQFQGHALRSVGFGALIGVVAGLATLAALTLALSGGDGELVPGLSLTPLDWVLLGGLFPAAAVVAAITARLTVLKTLTGLP